MFDETLLNAAVAGAFCNRDATWINQAGTSTIKVMFDITPSDFTEEVTRIGEEIIIAECESSTIEGMKRNDTLIILDVTYEVLNVQPDANGWAVITLEKS